MKKAVVISTLTLLLVSLAVPQAVSAKAATAIITVSGGRLPSAFAITQPQVLERSNVWLGNFFDLSRGPAKAPPRGQKAYELCFYVGFANESPSMRYIVYYYPRTSGQGYIYLPGHGEKYYYLNVGSIMRAGHDGRFNYADPTWENLIKPLIARAESPRR